jgi:hypothetical protein
MAEWEMMTGAFAQPLAFFDLCYGVREKTAVPTL